MGDEDMKKLIFINSKGEKLTIYKEPYFLSRIDGTEAVQNIIHTHKSLNQDGESYTGNTLGYRSITIEGAIREVNKKRVMQYRQHMLTVLNPKLHLCKLIYEYDGGAKAIDCIVDGSPTFPSSSFGVYQRFLIHLYCPDPCWRDLKESNVDLVTWVPNLEFTEEGFNTEQSPNYWIESRIKEQYLEIYPSGTVYWEPVIKDKAVYNNGITVELPIEELESVTANGVNIPLDTVTVAQDGLSFTSGLVSDGDIVEYIYWYPKELTTVPTMQVGKYAIEGGIGSLPKNSANGQVSVTIGGVTETDEEGNTKSTISAGRIKVVGKNLLNINNLKYYGSGIGSVKIDGNKVTITRNDTGAHEGVWQKVNVVPNQPYILSFKIEQLSGSTLNVFFSDRPIDLNSVPGYGLRPKYQTNYLSTTGYKTLQFTPTEKELWFATTLGTYNASATISEIQLEMGTQATAYESYQEDNVYFIAKDPATGEILEARSLPNNTKDEVNVIRGVKTQRINAITINGSESWIYGRDDGEYWRFYNTTIQNLNQFSKQNSDKHVLIINSNIPFQVVTYAGLAGDGEKIAFVNDGTTYVKILKTRLPEGTANAFKNWLATNQITLIYQLAEPEIILLPQETENPFEEFESGFGVGQSVEFGYRLTRQIVEIDNPGDVDTPIRVVFRAHGEVVKPYIQNVETYELLRINRALQAGDVLEIITEFGNKNIYLNGEKAHHYLDFLNSTWLQLKPGTNLIKYGAEIGVDMLECRLYYTPRYLGV